MDYGIQIAFVTPVSFGCRGEVLAKVKISLTHLNLDQPWHRNSLLPLAPQHFKLTDLFPDGSGLDQSVAGCFTTFALNNYSLLGPCRYRCPPRSVASPFNRFRICMNFVRMMVDFWAGTYGEECGMPLSFENLKLYHAKDWVIKPATAGQRGQGCSYVE